MTLYQNCSSLFPLILKHNRRTIREMELYTANYYCWKKGMNNDSDEREIGLRYFLKYLCSWAMNKLSPLIHS